MAVVFDAEVAVNNIPVEAEVESNLVDLVPGVDVIIDSGGGGLSNAAKDALLQIARKVVYVDAGGATYYNALYEALYPLASISAVYTQSGTVYDTDTLDSLKADLVVTATYGDGGTATVPAADYTLSGTLAVGTSTITVTYGGKTATFTVTVSAEPATLSSISAVYTQSGTVYDTDSLDSLKTDLVVTAHYSDSTSETVASTDYTLSGTLTEGTSTVTVTYQGKTDTFSVAVTPIIPAEYTKYDYITRSGVGGAWSAPADAIIFLDSFELSSLSAEFWYKGVSVHADGAPIFGGRSASGSTYSWAFYSKVNALGYHLHGNDTNPAVGSVPDDAVHHVVFSNSASSPSSIVVDDGTPVSVVWANTSSVTAKLAVLLNSVSAAGGSVAYHVQTGRIILKNLSGEVVADYYPVKRNADNRIGFYDTVAQAFKTSSTASYTTVGAQYEIGNWS